MSIRGRMERPPDRGQANGFHRSKRGRQTAGTATEQARGRGVCNFLCIAGNRCILELGDEWLGRPQQVSHGMGQQVQQEKRCSQRP